DNAWRPEPEYTRADTDSIGHTLLVSGAIGCARPTIERAAERRRGQIEIREIEQVKYSSAGLDGDLIVKSTDPTYPEIEAPQSITTNWAVGTKSEARGNGAYCYQRCLGKDPSLYQCLSRRCRSSSHGIVVVRNCGVETPNFDVAAKRTSPRTRQ